MTWWTFPPGDNWEHFHPFNLPSACLIYETICFCSGYSPKKVSTRKFFFLTTNTRHAFQLSCKSFPQLMGSVGLKKTTGFSRLTFCQSSVPLWQLSIIACLHVTFHIFNHGLKITNLILIYFNISNNITFKSYNLCKS